MARRTLTIDNEVAAELAGSGDSVLRKLEDRLDCDVFLRGNVITLDGPDASVSEGQGLVEELVALVERGHELDPGTIDSVSGATAAGIEPEEMLGDAIWRHRGTKVAPRTVNQKRYVDSIRKHTVSFGIGPAGTGKTFLAVAMAVAALEGRDVSRIILTRPAVEAGERLGFLPGDIQAKVDPYLRPLFDALYDMLDPDRVNEYFERGIIEVAPLAFMRGRAQPPSRQVLTPDGFIPLGQLRVGDLVVGSDGRPTPVLGIYPQGRKPVFRLRAQDGAETVCCGEHLWHVFTASDRRCGKPGRVLETQEMAAGLRGGRSYALPLVAPVEMVMRETPSDPYEAGRELALGDGLGLDRGEGAGGGVLLGTRSIPGIYLRNALSVRLGVLQGLLDGGETSIAERTEGSAIRYAATTPELRDGLIWLVRSLGGVALPMPDELVLDIRLPAGLQPFRLRRKREIYERDGGGPPMRFVDEIEPAGEEETLCIQVAAADSLYVTDDFLVTHNTLNDSFVILDEAQNTSPEQMKMFLTRLGFGSRMVVTGDITQIDLPANQRSGLIVVGEILAAVNDIEFIRFGSGDVVRHELVQRIVAAYDEFAGRGGADGDG